MKKLISLLSAKTPFEELPWPFNKSFQPGGDYSVLRAAVPFLGKNDRAEIDSDSALLLEFYEELSNIILSLQAIDESTDDIIKYLRSEIIRSLQITALRAKHRHYTLLAGGYRNHRLKDSSKYYVSNLLKSAEMTRKKSYEYCQIYGK